MTLSENRLPIPDARQYFDWSNQDPQPEIWEKVEMPAMRAGIEGAISGYDIAGVKVLDVGVGGGKTVGLLKKVGFSEAQITAVDISEEMLKLVAQKYPAITLRKANIAEESSIAELKDKSPFQIVTAHMVFNHLTDSQMRNSLLIVQDLLEDRGYLIGMVPYPENPAKLLSVYDDGESYVAKEAAPWGSEVCYYHRSFAAYAEYLDRCGYYSSLKAYPWGEGGMPKRLLIAARKFKEFKDYLDDTGLGKEEVKRHLYIPSRYRK
jgi:SAM-dependent methyltransferase